MSQFVHLHVHSEFSLLDGVARIDELVQAAVSNGMKALALTDHGAMHGVIPFYQACKRAKIKPIIGCEFYLAPRSIDQREKADHSAWHLTVLAMNHQGYLNLMKLSSIAYQQGFFYKPRIDFELLTQYAEGLIVLSGCMRGPLAAYILQDKFNDALQMAERFQKSFGDRFYIEIQDHGMFEQKQILDGLIAIHHRLSIPLVATNDVHYIRPEDAETQEVLMCIGTGKTLSDPDRFKGSTNQLWFKSEQEMQAIFPNHLEAVIESGKIAARCELQISFSEKHLPRYNHTPMRNIRTNESVGLNSNQLFEQLCSDGFQIRYANISEDARKQKYRERLEYEMQMIRKMGFVDYFLIVWDFMRFAFEQKIRTGPGRGSAAGSMVAYVLQITDVDPMAYDLLFERFLNPARVSLPDIDIDFPDDRRDEVIQYVTEKYGDQRVAHIVTFGTMAAKAAIRDVGRVMGIAIYEVDQITKCIPNQPGIRLKDAYVQNDQLAKMIQSKAHLQKLWDMAIRVEGLPRHLSTHAAGVVIASSNLDEFVPLQTGHHDVAMTQYSMEYLEKIGLLKMDFLGLRTLSIIQRTYDAIRDPIARRITEQNWKQFNDSSTFEMLASGETNGVFQLESAGMRKVLKELKPNCIEDLIAVLALYRPGPMEFIPQYIASKHQLRNVEYPHPNLEEILKDTYGIIVYQEQIMKIASKMAGFDLAEADILRRAISKKNREVLDEQRANFVKGSIACGYHQDEANQVYDLIVRFADYGFPRAHATAYAFLAYHTAYLKAKFPAEFMAAMMSSSIGAQEKIAGYVETCKQMGIHVLPPNVQKSEADFWADPQQKSIYFALFGIKQVGPAAIESIIKERRKSPFIDLRDFIFRVDLRVCNKKVIEALICSGAMDDLPGTRVQKLAVLDDVFDDAKKRKTARAEYQAVLNYFHETDPDYIEFPDMKEESIWQKVQWEQEWIGFALSCHPMDEFRDFLNKCSIVNHAELSELSENEKISISGFVSDIQTIYTKKKQEMAFAKLNDRTATVELLLFPQTWDKLKKWFQAQKRVIISGHLQHSEKGTQMIVEQAWDLDDSIERISFQRMQEKRNHKGSFERNARSVQIPNSILYIRVQSKENSTEQLLSLMKILKKHPGDTPVRIYYENEKKIEELNEQLRIDTDQRLIMEIESVLGKDSAKVKSRST